MARENQLAENFSKQGIAAENYPIYGTNFWGGSPENNYGFGTSNIKQNIENVTNRLNNNTNNGQVTTNSDYTVNTESLVGKPSSYFQNNNTSNTFGINQSSNATPALQNQTSAQLPNNSQQQLRMPTGSEQQITMPSYELQQQLQQPQTSDWNKIKNAVNNFADITETATVGYADGASLGNFDEGMGIATAAVTLNPNNYYLGKDATKQLQNDLEQRHPYVYNGAEIAGATFANKYFPSYLMPIVAGIGYAEDDVYNNILKNIFVSRFTRGIQKIPWISQTARNFGQNLASWYLLNKENQKK